MKALFYIGIFFLLGSLIFGSALFFYETDEGVNVVPCYDEIHNEIIGLDCIKTFNVRTTYFISFIMSLIIGLVYTGTYLFYQC